MNDTTMTGSDTGPDTHCGHCGEKFPPEYLPFPEECHLCGNYICDACVALSECPELEDDDDD